MTNLNSSIVYLIIFWLALKKKGIIQFTVAGQQQKQYFYKRALDSKEVNHQLGCNRSSNTLKQVRNMILISLNIKYKL